LTHKIYHKAPIFNQIISDYLSRVKQCKSRPGLSAKLGLKIENDVIELPFFNRRYRITDHAITDYQGQSVSHAISVVLCKYILLCPDDVHLNTDLMTYKDFKDAAPYVGGFRNTAEQPIAAFFEKKAAELEERSRELGGKPFGSEVACQLAFQFLALPRIPIILMFNDADQDFPSQCVLLFQKNAQAFLDMECLAMLGSALARMLQD
jgi:hypothetical protein